MKVLAADAEKRVATIAGVLPGDVPVWIRRHRSAPDLTMRASRIGAGDGVVLADVAIWSVNGRPSRVRLFGCGNYDTVRRKWLAGPNGALRGTLRRFI